MEELYFNGTSYQFTRTRAFLSIGTISNDQLDKCISFAYNMTFANTGAHRDHRTGGQARRKKGQIFANTLQGKIAEYAIYNELKNVYHNITEPDLSVYQLGAWDDSDLTINNKKLSIKSTKHYSQLLLLETRDWDANGNYIPNTNNGNSKHYDYFILVRIKAQIEQIMKKHKLLYSNTITSIEFNELKNSILASDWSYDIPGFITHNDLVELINRNFRIPRNALLNNTRMDATNYYVQAGDLRSIDTLNL